MAELPLYWRVARFIQRLHFRIPEASFWLLLVVAAVLLPTLATGSFEGLLLGLFALGIAIVGIGRWHWHRGLGRHALIVARFWAPKGHESRAEEAQRIIFDSICSQLPQDVRALAHRIPGVIGIDESEFAGRVLRRLRGQWLLHGRIAVRPDGGWSVFAAVVQPAHDAVLHYDLHTRDMTPLKGSWDDLLHRLDPVRDVRDEEYPIPFCEELRGILRASTGQVALVQGKFQEAEDALRRAIEIDPDSTSAQIDQLRTDLAGALYSQGGEKSDEAIALLRARVEGERPSPHLLRILHWLLQQEVWPKEAELHEMRELTEELEEEGDEEDDPELREEERREMEEVERDLAELEGEVRALREEGQRALRLALEDELDPLRDLTRYNLINALLWDREDEASHQEAWSQLDELIASSDFYRRTWYVKRLRGLRAWLEVEKAQAEERFDVANTEARTAAMWYSRMIRSRPRRRLIRVSGLPLIWLARFPRSPILHANAVDAHRVAEHRFRTLWHEFRFRRLRSRLMRRGIRRFKHGSIPISLELDSQGRALVARAMHGAYADFDWMTVGRNDPVERVAKTFMAAIDDTMDDLSEGVEDDNGDGS